MKKTVLFIIAILAISWSVNANPKNEKAEVEAAIETVNLTGSIFDSKYDETLPGASITIEGKKYYSDLSGSFSIPNLKKGKYSVTVDFISYQPQTVEIDLIENENLNIELKQQ